LLSQLGVDHRRTFPHRRRAETLTDADLTDASGD
jgi:hypothetical protein